MKPSKISNTFFARRAAGVVLPVAALPGPGQIGTIGPAALRHIDWLHQAGQRYWQILPLTLTDSLGSPYASPSSMAANWMLIGVEWLKTDHLIAPATRLPATSRTTNYRRADRQQRRLITASWNYFQQYATTKQRQSFFRWQRQHKHWLDEFTLYQAIKDSELQRPWWRWPKRWRTLAQARKHLTPDLIAKRHWHAYAQWLFDQEWRRVHEYARRKGVMIIGDMPFYVQEDSVEMWAHPELFHVNQHGRPQHIAGVPPDAFARHGQRWGNPLYRWSAHKKNHFRWWTERAQRWGHYVDAMRLDYFQGMAETYGLALTAKDGRRGHWHRTPGREILQALRKGMSNLIAEDVGHPEPRAEKLRQHFALPSSRIAQFGWNGLPDNIHHPRFVRTWSLYYTSTHDTNTTVGWWRHAKKYEQRILREWFKSARGTAWDVISIVWNSRAQAAMTTWPDLLNRGEATRYNRPGRRLGNWTWRLSPKDINAKLAHRLRRQTRTARR